MHKTPCAMHMHMHILCAHTDGKHLMFNSLTASSSNLNVCLCIFSISFLWFIKCTSCSRIWLAQIKAKKTRISQFPIQQRNNLWDAQQNINLWKISIWIRQLKWLGFAHSLIYKMMEWNVRLHSCTINTNAHTCRTYRMTVAKHGTHLNIAQLAKLMECKCKNPLTNPIRLSQVTWCCGYGNRYQSHILYAQLCRRRLLRLHSNSLIASEWGACARNVICVD